MGQNMLLVSATHPNNTRTFSSPSSSSSSCCPSPSRAAACDSRRASKDADPFPARAAAAAAAAPANESLRPPSPLCPLPSTSAAAAAAPTAAAAAAASIETTAGDVMGGLLSPISSSSCRVAAPTGGGAAPAICCCWGGGAVPARFDGWWEGRMGMMSDRSKCVMHRSKRPLAHPTRSRWLLQYGSPPHNLNRVRYTTRRQSEGAGIKSKRAMGQGRGTRATDGVDSPNPCIFPPNTQLQEKQASRASALVKGARARQNFTSRWRSAAV